MRKSVAFVAAIALAAALLTPVSAIAAAEHSAEDVVVVSDADGTEIAITVFRPAGTSNSKPVPVILHSHGWGGSRTATIGGEVEAFLDAGLGVVSIDQRGHGASGGQANVQDPELETEDIDSVIDYIAGLSWVEKNVDASGRKIAADPVLGAIGGSYGGGYQTMSALDEIAEEGSTRFDALAPEITWFDLNESLAPQAVPRTAWTSVLFAAGAAMVPQYIQEAFAWGAVTGQWPDGTVLGTPTEGVPDLASEFARHAPRHFSDQGIKLNVPMLQRQGSSDNLFNLNQGLHIFRDALTRKARSKSLFVAYNGGHALPNAMPVGTAGGTDACSGDWTALRIAFFKQVFAGKNPSSLLPGRYNFTNVDGAKCFSFNSTDNVRIDVDEDLEAGGGNSLPVPVGAGAPISLPLSAGPITVAGIPKLNGVIDTVVPDSRIFFGLSMGTTPADAQVIQNNLMPLRRTLPGTGSKFSIELPGVAVEVPEGQTLYLTITPVSDMYAAHGSRAPGAAVLTGLKLFLPTL